jgi:hypothetical protein
MVFTLYYKVLMNTIKRTIASTEWLLVLPGAIFMTALFVRSAQPRQYEPARTAQRLVDWFSVHPHLALDVFLIVMPLAAFVIGGATLLRSWQSDGTLRQTVAAVRAHLATLLIAGATLAAGGILAVVAVHMITD